MSNTKNYWEVCRNYYKEHFTYFVYIGGCVSVMLERWKQPFYNPCHGYSSILRLHCFYLSLALSPWLAHTHTHTHTHNNNNNNNNDDNNKAVSTISFLTAWRIWCQSFLSPDAWTTLCLSCRHYLVNICRLYLNVFPCASVCMCVWARARSPLPLFLKLKYHLCTAQHEACKGLFKYLIFYGEMCEMCNIFALHVRTLSVTQPSL